MIIFKVHFGQTDPLGGTHLRRRCQHLRVSNLIQQQSIRGLPVWGYQSENI